MTSHARSRRWLMLAISLVALITASAAEFGYAFLLPALRQEGFSIQGASGLLTAPILGVVAGLIAWGWAADRWGERVVLAAGLLVAGATLLVASQVRELGPLLVLLFLVGLGSAAVNPVSGRLILGWFAPTERGLAMGIRQTGQPLGVAMAALVLPTLAQSALSAPFLFLAVGSLVAGVLAALLVRDPERGALQAGGAAASPVVARTGSPYRTPYLWRIHGASGLLGIAQLATFTFAFDFLVTAQGWSQAAAGLVVGIGQVVGAGARIGAGWWSDRVGSRLGPMRILAGSIALTMAALGGLAALRTPLADAVLAVALVVTVSTNGLAYTAVAEGAGRAWAGRALGIQNTFQHLIGAGVPSAVGAILALSASAATGYAIAFAAAAAFPFVAVGLIPVGSEPAVVADSPGEP